MLVTWAPGSVLPHTKDALKRFRKDKSVIETVSEIDNDYYVLLSNSVNKVAALDKDAAQILRMDIDMKNMLTMLKAKRQGIQYSEVENSMIAARHRDQGHA